MKIKRRRIILKSLLCLALCLILGGGVILSAFPLKATAASTTYSNVLDDLKKDSSFNPDDYPAKADDYSLQVIQVAEGENGELFLYVYQPSDATKDLRASKINMSLQSPSEKEIENKIYSLTWINSNGVFDKYIVNDFKVSDELYRYYNIATIYRPFEDFDTIDDAVDTKQGKGYEVGIYWCAYNYNNIVFYESEKINVVDIDIHATGTIRYEEGFKLYADMCDSHYVGFSIENFDVNKIYDADITYTYRSVSYAFAVGIGESYEYGTPVPVLRDFLSSKETGFNDGDGLLGKKYTWNRIQSASDFLDEAENDANDTFSKEERTAIEKCDFVFRFLETDVTVNSYGVSNSTDYFEVTDIGILRLYFLTPEGTFNLGVVGDLVGTDNIPELNVSIGDNIINAIEESEWWYKILAVLALILILVLISTLGGPICWIIKTIFRGVKTLLSWLFFILTLPFRAIKALLK